MLRISELTHTLKSINMIKIWKYKYLYIKQNSTSITRNWFRKHIWLIRGAEKHIEILTVVISAVVTGE